MFQTEPIAFTTSPPKSPNIPPDSNDPGAPRHRQIRIAAILLILLILWSPIRADPGPARILVLHSYNKGLSWTESITRGIEDEFKTLDRPVDISYEYMDTKRIFDDTHLANLRRLIAHKLTKLRFDVVISSDDHAFRFLLANHAAIMPDTPVVFCGVNLFEEAMLADEPLFTGVVEAFDIRATILSALHIQPDLRKLVVVVDRTVSGKANRQQLETILPELPPTVEVALLDNRTMAEVQAAVEALPATAAVLWLHFTADRAGQVFTYEESAEDISAASAVPVYSFWDFHLNHGIIGGMITSGYQQGRTAAVLARRILKGTPVQDIAVVKKSPNRLIFDYNIMRRFRVSASRLPDGSTIINQPVSFYDSNRRLIWSLIAGFTATGAVILILAFNILQRRRAEQLLIASKDRYKHLFTAASVALIEEDCTALLPEIERIRTRADADPPVNPNSHLEWIAGLGDKIRIADANPAAVTLFEAANKTDLLGPVNTIVPPEAGPAMTALIAAILRGDTIFTAETVNRSLTGRTIDILLQLRLPQTPAQYDSVLVSVVDITDRKRSEQALRLSETRFRTAFNNAATGMALVAMDGRYLRVNRALCRILGYAEPELLHMTWMDITHPDDIPAGNDFIRQLCEGTEPGPVEKRYIDKWGRTIWVLLSGSVIFDDNRQPVYMISQMQDITRRRAAEEALREQEQRYRRFFEDDLSGVFVATAEGGIIACNRVFARMFGHADTAEAMTHPFPARFQSPEDYRSLITALAAHRSLQHQELHLQRLDGHPLVALINAVGRYNEQGRLDEFQGYLMDVTRQRSLESQLLQAQKMESIGTMAGGVAHDFNNLLMGVLGNTSLILMNKTESDPDYARLRNIEEYVQSGSELTRQLLGFAKGGKYEVRPLNVNRLIERNAEMFGRTRKDVRIELALDQGLRLIEADRSQIDQVLYNLYLNAWQAMADGGTMTICTTNRELVESFVEPYGLPPGAYVRIRVTDDGIGMAPETLKRIFDPFFTTKEISRGTGLGLASAYGIIKNHGGIITVRSQPGAGTAFDLYLPASEHQAESPIQAAPESAPVGGGETLLLVDDEPMIVDVGKGMLTALGYGVVTAESGPAAIEAVKADPGIALVILDMIMPGMSGGETFDAIRAVRPDIRVLLSSGYSLDGQAEQIMDRGCNGFMQKPFSMNELSRRIRDTLDSD